MNIKQFNDWLSSEDKQSLIMGILNVTPDSFSDGGQYFKKNTAIEHALEMVKNGADIIDIGGESTRPFSDPVSLDEEISRVIPVIEGIRKKSDVCISIDTTKSIVAGKALDVGASIINDISAMEIDPLMADVAVKFDCPLIIMHMKGTPKNMQDNPQYESLIPDIKDYLVDRIDFAISKGINRKKIIIDPGIGFGKNLKHNITIMNNISIFHSLGFPIMLGSSRKRFIKYISGKNDSNFRLGGTLASSIHAMMNGVQIMRVHDFNEISQGLKVFKSINK